MKRAEPTGFDALHDPLAGLIVEADFRAGATFRLMAQGSLKRGFGLPDSLLVTCNLVIGIDLYFHQNSPDFLARHRFPPHYDSCGDYARPIGLRPAFSAPRPLSPSLGTRWIAWPKTLKSRQKIPLPTGAPNHPTVSSSALRRARSNVGVDATMCA